MNDPKEPDDDLSEEQIEKILKAEKISEMLDFFAEGGNFLEQTEVSGSQIGRLRIRVKKSEFSPEDFPKDDAAMFEQALNEYFEDVIKSNYKDFVGRSQSISGYALGQEKRFYMTSFTWEVLRDLNTKKKLS
jgi:hypothetical protein